MIYIVLPAYHEEVGLEPLVQKIAQTMATIDAEYQIVVVNDGSLDKTGEILTRLVTQYPIHVITHRRNRGLGETIRDGFEYVADVASRSDMIVRMDCDDTHDPKYILAMIEKLSAGYEVAIASRYAPGGGQTGVSAYRRFISRGANTLMKICFPIRGVWEYTSGYRGYRVALIKDCIELFGNRFIDLKGMGFTGTVEKIIKCRMLGARITEVGFVLRYDRKSGPSKVVTSLTTLGYLVLIAKYFYPWGQLGDIWKAAAEERRRRAYRPDGLPVETLVITRARAAAPQ
jgi:dolichol-phosphate mannosyltransferase